MTPPLKVVRIIARLNVGGPARHVTILDGGLRARGYVTLLVHGEIGPGEATLEHLVADTAIPSRRIAGLGRRVSPFADLKALISLVRLIFEVEPDIVHTHTAKAGTLGRLSALFYNVLRRRGKRSLVVHTFHGHVLHGYFSVLASVAIRVIERALALWTDSIVVLSEHQRRDLVDRFRVVSRERVYIVPLGLELDRLLRLPRGLRGGTGAIVFGFVGRFVPIKNVPLLIEAFAMVIADLPAARLLLVGDGEGRADAEADIARRRLQDAVTFTGWREDLERIYREMDVLVLTSINEGTPVAVIEAMAAALPVIATEVGGVPDVVHHGSTGLLIPSGSAVDLAAAMRRLANRPAECEEFGARGREAVRTRFSSQRLVADIDALYRSRLHAKRHGPR